MSDMVNIQNPSYPPTHPPTVVRYLQNWTPMQKCQPCTESWLGYTSVLCTCSASFCWKSEPKRTWIPTLNLKTIADSSKKKLCAKSSPVSSPFPSSVSCPVYGYLQMTQKTRICLGNRKTKGCNSLMKPL
jgi:hypothetical protein